MRQLIIHFICMSFIVGIIDAQFNNLCRTPTNESGTCIVLKSCSKLLSLIENRKEIVTAAATLKNSFCGYERRNAKVCCPTDKLSPISTSVLPSQDTCGYTNITRHRIVGGMEAPLGAWPWIASIGYQRKSKNNSSIQWACGGTLISNRHVLTATHCVIGLGNFKLTTVRLGESDLNPKISDGATPLDILVERIIPHENYTLTQKVNDIALLKLIEIVEFTDLIQPICLPIPSNMRYLDAKDNKPYVAGWGSTIPTRTFFEPPNTKLMEVEVPIVDLSVCKLAYQKEIDVIFDDRVLCAGYLEGGKDSCQGDSGGPLMSAFNNSNKYYLVGIVSYGSKKCAEAGLPALYTRVTTFLDWIVDNVNMS